MKQLFCLLSILLLLTTDILFAQAPQQMSYQAVLRNNSNSLIINAAVGMKISILQGSATGSVVYGETQTPSTNANGLISIAIGTGTVLSGNFSSVDWSTGLYFIKSEIDPSGGNAYSIITTTQFLSVPYSLYAEKSGPRGQTIGDMQYWDGTKWVLVPAGTDGQNLTMCNGTPQWAPCGAQDVATLQQYTLSLNGDGSIHLYWITSVESNVDHFEYQRQLPGETSFTSISNNPAGDQGTGLIYGLDDFPNVTGIIQYRLIVIFLDLSTQVLATKSITR